MSSYLDWDDHGLREILKSNPEDVHEDVQEYVERYYNEHFCEHTFSAGPRPHADEAYCAVHGDGWYENLELDYGRLLAAWREQNPGLIARYGDDTING